ncbi:hypothetical protein AYO45_00825 [Gammaproteobacteria bacterium SCGC AG-212-F23]|nr:hypothetical protein AYO45_00825 [Gammaproteobacteria bacterium SCGC AG-212-F23]
MSMSNGFVPKAAVPAITDLKGLDEATTKIKKIYNSAIIPAVDKAEADALFTATLEYANGLRMQTGKAVHKSHAAMVLFDLHTFYKNKKFKDISYETRARDMAMNLIPSEIEIDRLVTALNNNHNGNNIPRTTLANCLAYFAPIYLPLNEEKTLTLSNSEETLKNKLKPFIEKLITPAYALNQTDDKIATTSTNTGTTIITNIFDALTIADLDNDDIPKSGAGPSVLTDDNTNFLTAVDTVLIARNLFKRDTKPDEAELAYNEQTLISAYEKYKTARDKIQAHENSPTIEYLDKKVCHAIKTLPNDTSSTNIAPLSKSAAEMKAIAYPLFAEEENLRLAITLLADLLNDTKAIFIYQAMAYKIFSNRAEHFIQSKETAAKRLAARREAQTTVIDSTQPTVLAALKPGTATTSTTASVSKKGFFSSTPDFLTGDGATPTTATIDVAKPSGIVVEEATRAALVTLYEKAKGFNLRSGIETMCGKLNVNITAPIVIATLSKY